MVQGEEEKRNKRDGRQKNSLEEFTLFILQFPTLSSFSSNWALEEKGEQTKRKKQKKKEENKRE